MKWGYPIPPLHKLQKAELSTGIVSHYFGDKQGLINTCMQEMLNVLRLKTEQYRAEADSHPESQIKAIIDSNFDISQVNEKQCGSG